MNYANTGLHLHQVSLFFSKLDQYLKMHSFVVSSFHYSHSLTFTSLVLSCLQSTLQTCHLACLSRTSLQGWSPVLEQPSDTGSTTHWWPLPGSAWCLSQHVSHVIPLSKQNERRFLSAVVILFQHIIYCCFFMFAFLTGRIYKCLFTGSVSSLLTLPLDMLST